MKSTVNGQREDKREKNMYYFGKIIRARGKKKKNYIFQYRTSVKMFFQSSLIVKYVHERRRENRYDSHTRSQ